MPTLERQEVSAPSWETCLRLPLAGFKSLIGYPLVGAGPAYLFGIFKRRVLSQDEAQ